MVDLIIDGERKKISRVPKNCMQLLKNLEISRQEALVKIDGRFRDPDSSLAGVKRIEIIRVVFGG